MYESLLYAIEAASSQGCEDDGATGTLIRQSHIAAICTWIDGHLWNHRDAYTRPHHCEYAAELAALEGDVGGYLGAAARSNAEISKAVAIPQHDKWFTAKIFRSPTICKTKFEFLK